MKLKYKPYIRARLIISLLTVVVIGGTGSIVISLHIINENILGQAYDEVQSSLNTAHYIYNSRINVISLFIKHLSSLTYLQRALIQTDRTLLTNKLLEVKRELNIDMLNITDTSGRIIVRANNNLYSDDVSDNVFIKKVIETGESFSGTNIISNDHLAREKKGLSRQAYIRVVPTPMARTEDRSFEDRGMVLMAASPVNYNGRFIGVIYGARLLNNNFEFVDKIKSLVFKDEKIDGFDIGTATVFMDDLRISTNVKNSDGTRAIGTQVSEEVYTRVVERGMTWLDKAFVVNNWYISAYCPIYGISKEVVGILYAGILEEKYNKIKKNTYLYYVAMIGIASLAAVIISLFLIKSIITPIKTLVRASNNIARGIYTEKLEINSDDEMGYLCSAFNKMLDAIDERDKKLKEHTERQMVQSEKLASLGRLASGIAHEINNPLTGVLGYSTSLIDDLRGTEHEEDLQVIIDETMRCRKIVKGILDFARDSKLEMSNVNINAVIEQSVSILEKHVNFQNINIIKNFSDGLPEIEIDVNQFKSVINNLALNAADAMPGGGTLTISTAVSYNDKGLCEIVIEVRDTGTGISPENLKKIFDPFFSTKEAGKGTGLGLSVTKKIVERHNGSISAASRAGKWTLFTIKLPIKG